MACVGVTSHVSSLTTCDVPRQLSHRHRKKSRGGGVGDGGGVKRGEGGYKLVRRKRERESEWTSE